MTRRAIAKNPATKLLAMALTAVLCVLLAGCSSDQDTASGGAEQSEEATTAQSEEATDEASGEPEFIDDEFVAAIGPALEARWAITDQEPDDVVSADLTAQGVQAELDGVEAYKDGNFENEDLAQYAKLYIEALENSDANDYVEANERWVQNYNQRVISLYQINEISPITVSEEKQTTLSQLLSDGKDALAASELMENVEFTAEDPEYEGQTYLTYTAVVENTTDTNFAYFFYDLNLVDADGVVVETLTAETDNWAPGTKHSFEFSTDKQFDHVEIVTANWSV